MSKFQITWGFVSLLVGAIAVFICIALAALKGGNLGLLSAVVALTVMVTGRKKS